MLGKAFLVGSYFLSSLLMYHPTLPWPARLLLRKLLIAYEVSFHGKIFFSLAVFRILSLSLILDSFITICLGEDVFVLNLFRDL